MFDIHVYIRNTIIYFYVYIHTRLCAVVALFTRSLYGVVKYRQRARGRRNSSVASTPRRDPNRYFDHALFFQRKFSCPRMRFYARTHTHTHAHVYIYIYTLLCLITAYSHTQWCITKKINGLVYIFSHYVGKKPTFYNLISIFCDFHQFYCNLK